MSMVFTNNIETPSSSSSSSPPTTTVGLQLVNNLLLFLLYRYCNNRSRCVESVTHEYQQQQQKNHLTKCVPFL
ncbi:unnamed protein product [Schistosoma curassoni]|uniref:Uncharacterized protein n=1 Tax=Schistosoma curassoni TaxID=6186 RepID=A0A183JZV9_9TREM|nr:unnamed protein product [Schistosoma curassoni]